MADQSQLADILLQRGFLQPDQVEQITKRATEEGKTFEEIVKRETLVFPEQLAQAKAELLGVPYINLGEVGADTAAMKDISRSAASTYRFFVFNQKEGKLLVAMESPEDFQAQEAVRFIAKKRGLTPEMYLASAASIEKALSGTSEVQAEIGTALTDFSREVEETNVAGKEDKDIERLVEEAPVTKVVAVLIRHAIEGAASDIHIEPTEKDVRVRYRIDGSLHTSLLLPYRVHSAIISRVKILSNLRIDESRLPQDGRFTATIDGKGYDFRVSTMPTTFGEKVALRILDKSQGAPTFEELGLEGPMQATFKEHLRSPNGIILVSGPTGSGKSTTLFTSLTMLNTPDVNIATLEDPVEYEIEGVNQTQINPEIGLNFASGLRTLLRQDPDILMVGEIRDKETAALAVHASLTGHLVLSTIHTNDAVGAMPRLTDMEIDPFLLTATLRLIAAQRLVSRLCQQCKEPAPIPDTLQQTIASEIAALPDEYKTHPNQKNPQTLFTSKGCPACHETGVVGRLGIFEIIPISRDLRAAINENADYDTLRDIAEREGNLTLRQDGLLKALAGKIRYEDVLRVTHENSL